MKILSIDCSAVSASVAVLDSGENKAHKLLSSSYTNVGLTHSQTLVPMIASTLENAGICFDDIQYFAINAGPGSFTGVRIGMAALKGLTEFDSENCYSISTLESMAYNYLGVKDAIICAAMDARCGQVYTACFEVLGEKVSRMTEDSALLIEELGEYLKSLEKHIIFVGDGASLCYNGLKEKISCSVAPAHLIYQNAVSVALCAESKILAGEKPMRSKALLPVYLRAPQAERELKAKAAAKNKV